MQHQEDVSAKIAEYLLQINAIRLEPAKPFTWASGWKSPIYSDNRLILSHPAIRSFIKKELSKLVQLHFGEANGIIGVATAGIAPGALVADELQMPFGYVRSEAKKHGMGKQVEGDLQQLTNVVVVEDLVSTGKSSLQAVHVMREAGVKVSGLVSIFTYGFDEAEKNFAQAGCTFRSLCNYHTLINVALTKGLVKPDEQEALAAWRRDPANWGNTLTN